MAKFDRYILAQLMMLFGFFSLVLILVYWVNRAVLLFDQLIASGQSAEVFLEFTALTLPNIIRLVLPIAALAASIYVANRVASESELVVVQAAGYSPYRIVRPVLTFGIIVALLVSVLTHFLVPLSLSRLAFRQAEISENVAAQLLAEGQFVHPSKGVTFYVREITPLGELRDVLLNDMRNADEHVTYTADRALLIRHETGPKLVMFEGMAQALGIEGQRLAVTRFDDFTHEVINLIDTMNDHERVIKELTTLELLFSAKAAVEETGETRGALVHESHDRTNQALLATIAALIGFSALLLGNFSRLGLWRQIVGAVVAAIVLKSVDNVFADLVRSDATLWPFTYGATVLGLAAAIGLLWIAGKPGLFRRRKEAAA